MHGQKNIKLQHVIVCVPADFRTWSLQTYTQKLYLMCFVLLRFIWKVTYKTAVKHKLHVSAQSL